MSLCLSNELHFAGKMMCVRRKRGSSLVTNECADLSFPIVFKIFAKKFVSVMGFHEKKKT